MRTVAALLALCLLFATGSLAQDQDHGPAGPPEKADTEMAKAAEVRTEIRRIEQTLRRAETQRLAGKCEEAIDAVEKADLFRNELVRLYRSGEWPISREGLAGLALQIRVADSRPCPADVSLQTSIRRVEALLTEARNEAVRRDCDKAQLLRGHARAVIDEVEPGGQVPPALIASWRTQIRAADAHACSSIDLVPPTTIDCPALVPPGATTVHCRCMGGQHRGQVFGTYYYSASSELCTAARHAGAIGIWTSPVRANVGPGRSYYVASTRNGITSEKAGRQERTMAFVGTSDPLEERRGQIKLCQFKFSVYSPEERRRSVTCRCITGHPGATGTVYGSGPYAGDSNVCSAARHAGVLTSDDGLVTATAGPEMRGYQPSTRNGVTTLHWDYYPESMTVTAAR